MKAKAALNAGEVDLAKKALSNKVKADENVKQYQQMYEQISAQTAQLREQVEALKSKLDEAKSRQAMLIARSQMQRPRRTLHSLWAAWTPPVRWISSTAWKKR